MNRGVFFALGLALVVADSALADDGLLPVELPQTPALPALPAVPQVPVLPLPTVVPQPSGAAPTGGAPSVSRAAPSGSGGRSIPNASAGAPAARPAATPPAVRVVTSRRPAAAPAQAVEETPRRVARRERALRRTVRRHRACLGGLPSLERRVLVMRAGLGARDARTRARAARALDMSIRRIARVERRGLRRLRGLARGGCGADTAAPAAFERVTFAAATLLGTPARAAPERDRVEVKGEQRSSLGLEPQRAPKLAPLPAVAEPPAAVVRPGREGRFDLAPVLLALVALLCIAFGIRDLLRRA
jgi:hypothetical protein